MATIGQSLSAPEAGWRRYDDTAGNIVFVNTWEVYADSNQYGGSMKWTTVVGASAELKFKGTKLRIIGRHYADRSATNTVIIDGVSYTFSQRSATVEKALSFEITGLSDSEHTVKIVAGDTGTGSGKLSIDAIDIDDTGRLLHPYLTERTSLADMEIGDVISCEYVAASGAAGTFSKLGAATKTVLPASPVAVPDGAFYFIKVKEGLLIADRVVQNYVSWTTLNAAGMIEGAVSKESVVPNMTSRTTPAPFTVSTEYEYSSATYYSDKAFDGNQSTYMNSGVGATYVQVSTSGDPITVNEITVLPLSGYTLGNWVIQVSDDGNTWRNVSQSFGITGASWVSVSIPKTTARHWRLKRDTPSSAIAIYEIKFYNHKDDSKIRALSGGIAWADANGNFSLTNQSKGCFPTLNEWDSYVLGSTLGGKIAKGDPKIWNLDVPVCSICMETNADGVTQTDGSTASINTRTLRGRYNTVAGFDSLSAWGSISSAYANMGFRPVMEYVDPKLDASKKPSSVWY